MCHVCVYCNASGSLSQQEDVAQIPVYVKCCNPFHMSQGTRCSSIRRIVFKFCVGKYFLFIVRIILDIQKKLSEQGADFSLLNPAVFTVTSVCAKHVSENKYWSSE
jgi:hypothetical protein